jgi:hypothetical protein
MGKITRRRLPISLKTVTNQISLLVTSDAMTGHRGNVGRLTSADDTRRSAISHRVGSASLLCLPKETLYRKSGRAVMGGELSATVEWNKE